MEIKKKNNLKFKKKMLICPSSFVLINAQLYIIIIIIIIITFTISFSASLDVSFFITYR